MYNSKLIKHYKTLTLLKMYRSHFICFLAILMFFQSIIAVYDTHEDYHYHADNLDVSYEHNHNINKSNLQAAEDLVQYPNDCHHYSHCHGHNIAALTYINYVTGQAAKTQNLSNYIANITSGVPPSLLRPPIV